MDIIIKKLEDKIVIHNDIDSYACDTPAQVIEVLRDINGGPLEDWNIVEE